MALASRNPENQVVDVRWIEGEGSASGGGDASAANQTTQITAANLTNTNLGATDESAATSDSATSGLNGLVKRLLAQFTTFLARFTFSSATVTSVNSATSSTSILASNSSRKGVTIWNTDAYLLRIKYGTTASATSFTFLIEPGDGWIMPDKVYTGAIEGIWDGDGAGAAIITEYQS